MNLDGVKMLASAAVGMLDGSVLGPLEGYAGKSAGAFGLSLMILGGQLDSAAANLTDENAALRALLGGAATRVGGELGERLAREGAARDEDLHVHALQASNDALRELLIELHSWAEEQGAAAADLEAAIWEELRRSTERRQVALGPF